MNQDFILGTANFFNPYGSVKTTAVKKNEVKEILEVAQMNGIFHFDTARSYKGVEQNLGKFLDKSLPIKVDSKINKLDCGSINQIVNAVVESTKLLGIEKLSTLYLHEPRVLTSTKGELVIKGLEKVLELGIVEQIGVSVYTYSDLVKCISNYKTLTSFQVLENIGDRRLINRRELYIMKNFDIKINVRSVFLQGLLLTDPAKLNHKFIGAVPTLLAIRSLVKSLKVSPLDICVAYARSIEWREKIIIGVDNSRQLKAIIDSQNKLPSNFESLIPRLPPSLLDPRGWKM
jgi:aryl-alcohol dehydrogenase-like predicted oxidoreductase